MNIEYEKELLREEIQEIEEKLLNFKLIDIENLKKIKDLNNEPAVIEEEIVKLKKDKISAKQKLKVLERE